jgi:hypothetical protein
MTNSNRSRLSDLPRRTAPRALSPNEALLINRQEAALVLNCSTMTVKRMQWEGKLKGFQLREGPTSPFMYRKADVYKLAGITLPT